MDWNTNYLINWISIIFMPLQIEMKGIEMQII